ncbi:RNA polymerase sigma factor [Pedobacter nyackensis]|uniref:RNA polymerase sigma factor n=1 Tax=Pedobacter nyackensis TaxID=475255 RepID=UPI00292D16AD|nr:sigma-70 family RNA polymerase sigma factor [Pedobacter nyackensis]
MKVTDTKNELSLLTKVAEGDEHSFSLLFNRYRPNIYTTALRITGDEWVAEEILQDTFLKVWVNRTTLPYLDNFGGWLYTIAKNLTFNSIKHAQSERKKLLNITRESISIYYRETDYLAEENEFNKILNQAIERLSPKQKLTYKLIKEQGMKREEAASALNVSAETIKWNLDQAMKSIRAFCMVRLKDLPLIIVLYFSAKYF